MNNAANTKATIPVQHPDTIPGLAPDCRRVLRSSYLEILAALQHQPPPRIVEITAWPDGTSSDRPETRQEYTSRVRAETKRLVARAITRYREVAEMWGVDVG